MILYGLNPVDEALKSAPERISRIWVVRGKSSPRLQRIIDRARQLGLTLQFERELIIREKAGTTRHQNVAAEVSAVPAVGLEDLVVSAPKLLLLVDGVEDPRNLGALLRTAEATGVEGVLIPTRRTCEVTPLVAKASAGAVAHLRFCRVGNVARALDFLKARGYWVVGLDPRGEHAMPDLDVSSPLVVAVGGEQRGLRKGLLDRCDYRVALPMKGSVPSLNLSVAAAVVLYGILFARLRRGKE